jgi:RNA polymerase primary sigma factor
LAELRNKTRRLLENEIDFIGNREFCDRGAAGKILSSPESVGEQKPTTKSKMPKDLPAHLARLCESQLLSAQQERDLFRRMNYLKYRANVLRASLDAENPDADALSEAELYLDQARTIRNRIVCANIRLVVSIVRKYVSPQRPFDDLLSEGMETLIAAVDRFDYGRGFRFSTYAYRAIARTAYRSNTDGQRETNRSVTGLDDTFFDAPEDPDPSSMDEKTWNALRHRLTQMLDQLDRREQLIIRARYGLGAHRKARTCQAIADKLGISKERVRQLQQRAVAKLRDMAAENQLDKLLEPAISL